jgi:SPP1 family predicted phage head-tail adaptor
MAKECLCANDLQHRISIESPTESADSGGYGDVTPTWKQEAKAWAMIETLGSREVYRAQQTYAATTHVITIRYSRQAADFTTKMRVKFGARYLYITGLVNIDERNDWIRLFCTEAV